MEERTINQLSHETIKVISSAQIATTISAVVKELVENSLDAGATNIQVKLDNFGLGMIEVKDDGPGVDYGNVQRMFLPGFTSKISDFRDLCNLQSYGFRGEALSAICQLGETSITTKTEKDAIAMAYVIDRDGVAKSSKPSHIAKGTIVSVRKIFSNLPVRKQYASSKKKMTEELKKVETIVQSLSVIHPGLRMLLIHNKCTIWQKNSVSSLKQSFMQVVGLRIASRMEYLREERGDVTIEMMIPKKDLSDLDGLFVNSASQAFVHINKRPVFFKEIAKLIAEQVSHHFQDTGSRYVLYLVSMSVLPEEIDVNLEPNKTRVLLRNLEDILSLLRGILIKYYGNATLLAASAPVDLENGKTVNELETSMEDNVPSKKIKFDEEITVLNPTPRKEPERRNWTLTVLNDDQDKALQPSALLKPTLDTPVCSQINKDNCTLTTDKEVSQLNDVLSTTWGSNLASILQSAEKKMSNAQKPVLQDWPCRQQTPEKYPSRRPTLPDWPVRQMTPQKVAEVRLPSLEKTPPQPLAEASRNFNNTSLLFNHVSSTSAYEASTVTEERTVFEDRGQKISEERAVTEDGGQKISEADWSRGRVYINNGNILNSGAALVNPQVKEDVGMFDLSLQSVSSQMGKKELSAFTKYARIMRPKITSEQPGIVFTEVSKRLVEGWRELSSDEKEYYEEIAKAVDEERKIHRQQPKNASALPKRKSEKEFQQPVSRKVKIKRPVRKQVDFTITLEKITAMSERRKRVNDAENGEVRLVGQLNDTKDWLYYKDGEIGHIRHGGLQELVLYHKMLNSHEISRRKLDTTVLLTEDVLGISWKILLLLPTEYDEASCRNVVVSDIVTKNGFRIEFLPADIPKSAALTELASDIENYGVADLKEALHLYDWHGELAGLSDFRPTAVKKYIMSEVIRIVEKNRTPPEKSDIDALLCTWQLCLRHLPPKCLHQRDVFVPIFKISSINQSDPF